MRCDCDPSLSTFIQQRAISHPVMSLCPYDTCPVLCTQSLQALEACQLCIDELGLSSEISAEAFLEEREQRLSLK